jgi:NADH dehydrogenase
MILVVGATGSLGGRIAHELLARGDAVRVLVRPTSDHASLAAAGAEVVIGDLKDPASLLRACEGVDAVITTATMSRRGDDSPENVDMRGNINLIDAAKQARVRQFVFVSTQGASPDHPVPVFRAKGVAEQHLRESGLSYTILQPDAFMDVWFGMLIEAPSLSGQPVTLVGESLRRHSFVAEKDVAAFAANAVRVPDAKDTTLAIGGPEGLTFRDVVRAYEEAGGRKIPVRSVAPGEPIPGVPEPVWGIAAALEEYDSVIPMEETARRYGVAPTSARAFAAARTGSAAR